MFRFASLVFYILVYSTAWTEEAHQRGPNPLSDFLRKHTDICACVNVPFEANHAHTWFMNSHGNDLLAYFEPNCLQKKWKPIYMAIDLHHNNGFYKHELEQNEIELQKRFTIRSFGPNPSSQKFKISCNKTANIAIMGLEMLETHSKLTRPITCTNNSKVMASKRTHQIDLFALEHFEDFVLTVKVTNTCTNILPRNVNHRVTTDIRSIRTSECVILFSETNCVGRSTAIQSPGTTNLDTHWESTVTGSNTLSLLYKSFPNWIWETKSFKSCSSYNENQGLNVDITEFHINSNASLKSEILQTFHHLCSCQNIPKHVRSLKRWSVNNHENSMVAYFEQDCGSRTFKPLWIPAGQSSYSIALGAFGKVHQETNNMHKIMSIGPDHDSCYFKTNCIKLFSVITKFEIIDQNYTEQTVEMESDEKSFRNNAPKPIIQTFAASETVKDSFTVDIADSLKTIQKVELENAFEVENKMKTNKSKSNTFNAFLQAGISAKVGGPLKKLGVDAKGSISGGVKYEHSTASFKSHEAFIKEGLRKAYQNGSIVKSSKKTSTILENTRSVTVSQLITIPPCSEQVVHAYVKMGKNRNIEYRALVKVTGQFGTRDMTAIEVRKFMDDRMQYVGDYDEHTILAYSTTGLIKADYGVTTLFSTTVEPIPECLERYHLSSGSTFVKANPLMFLLIIIQPVVSFLLDF